MIRSIIRWLIYLLAIIVLLLCFLMTPTGFRLAINFAKEGLPGQLHYKTINGGLLGPIDIQGLNYSSPDNSLSVKSAHLAWNPFALLIGNISIKKLVINQVVIHHQANTQPEKKPSKKETRQSEKLHLPLDLHIGLVNINNVKFSMPKKPALNLANLTMSGTMTKDHMNFLIKSQLVQPYQLTNQINFLGNLDHYTIKFYARSHHLHWQFNIAGDATQATITTQHGKTLSGNLDANAHLHWYPNNQWAIKLRSSHLDLSQIDPNLPKSLNTQINTQGEEKNGHYTFDATAKVQSKKIHIDVDAHRHQHWKMQWNIHIQQLSQLWPTLFGQIDTTGNWQGDLSQYRSTAQVKLSEFLFDKLKINQLNTNWNINSLKPAQSNMLLTAQDIEHEKQVINRIMIKNHGNLTHQSITATVKNSLGRVALQLTNQKQTDHWLLHLKSLNVVHSRFGHWLLQSPSTVYISPNKLNFSPLCFSNQKSATLCSNGNWSRTQPWEIQLTGKNIKTHRLSNAAALNFKFNSTLTLAAKATGTGENLKTLHANLTIAPGSISHLVGSKMIHAKFQGGKLSINNKGKGLLAQLHFSVNKTDEMLANLHLPSLLDHTVPIKKQPLLGKLNIKLHNPDIIASFIPSLSIPQGQLNAHFTAQGTLGNPIANGKLDFDHGIVKLDTLGITLKKINFLLTAEQKKINFSAKAFSDNQPITAEGHIQLDQEPPTLSMKIHGDRVLLINTPEYHAYVSPDLNISSKNAILYVAGNITIPKAQLKPRAFYSTVSLPMNEMEFIGGQPTQEKDQSEIQMDLRLKLGDDVNISAYGLSGSLGGGLHITKQPKRPVFADGRINLTNAHYDAFGEKLKIGKSSHVQYIHSPITNPNLSMSAYRNIQSINSISGQQFDFNYLTVGLKIRGTVRRPKFILYSQPAALSKTDILSYLVTGSAASSNAAALSLALQASNSLDLSGSSGGVESTVKRGLGLSELGVESQTTYDAVGNPIEKQNSFVVGKRLSNKLYLRYSYGLLTPVNTIQVRYLLNRHWAVQTDTSTLGTGGDIIYTLEH